MFPISSSMVLDFSRGRSCSLPLAGSFFPWRQVNSRVQWQGFRCPRMSSSSWAVYYAVWHLDIQILMTRLLATRVRCCWCSFSLKQSDKSSEGPWSLSAWAGDSQPCLESLFLRGILNSGHIFPLNLDNIEHVTPGSSVNHEAGLRVQGLVQWETLRETQWKATAISKSSEGQQMQAPRQKPGFFRAHC